MYSVQEQEERDFVVATTSELSYADAKERGAHCPQAKWVCSDWDAWYLNPHWDGTNPNQHHPECECGPCYGEDEYDVTKEADWYDPNEESPDLVMVDPNEDIPF